MLLAIALAFGMPETGTSRSSVIPPPDPASARVLVAPDILRLAGGSTRTENCNSCCASRQQQCYSDHPQAVCDAEFQNCIATCTSQGSSPSEWGQACWANAG